MLWRGEGTTFGWVCQERERKVKGIMAHRALDYLLVLGVELGGICPLTWLGVGNWFCSGSKGCAGWVGSNWMVVVCPYWLLSSLFCHGLVQNDSPYFGCLEPGMLDNEGQRSLEASLALQTGNRFWVAG